MTEKLHSMAAKYTPPTVTVPNNWAGLITWALTKWGVGAVFMAMVYFLYIDLRESNRQFAMLVQANTAAIGEFSSQLQTSHAKVEIMKETVSKIVTNTEAILRSRQMP